LTTTLRLVTALLGLGLIDVQYRLSRLVAIVSREFGASAQETLKTENQSAIVFLDVSPGSRRIRLGLELNQVVPVIDSPIFCLPAFGNISTVFQPFLDRKIPSGSIRAGLAARYDFAKHFRSK
jgi:hypothetical protein